MIPRNAAFWISELQLIKHIEGGSFRETYRSATAVIPGDADTNLTETRVASTAIYFLLEQGQYSAFHKIKSDEIWHFYDGDPLDIFEIDKQGALIVHKLGRDISKGESFQVVIPATHWFGSRVAKGGSFSLVGCTVAPGFEFADFELADRDLLTAKYPKYHALIAEMTYK